MYIEVNGIKLHTMIVGSGEPILMLHGFPDFWYAWKYVMLMLKDDFKLIIPSVAANNLSFNLRLNGKILVVSRYFEGDELVWIYGPFKNRLRRLKEPPKS